MMRRSVPFYHSGRPVKVGVRALNPLWWLLNVDRRFDERFTFFGVVINERFPDWVRQVLFAIRNPGHNLTHYVLGIAHRDFIRYGDAPHHVWNPNGRWNVCWCEVDGREGWPYVAYKGRWVEFYIGWRQAGNLGIALRKSQ